MLLKSWAALAVALTLPLLNGCGIDDANDGNVRLVNATTEFATMDLYDGNTLLTSGVATNTVGGYAGVEKGSVTFGARNGGASANSQTTTQTVAEDKHFTIVSYVNAGALQLAWLTDDEPAPDSGTAKLRIFNAAPSEAAGVDVYVTSSACSALGIVDAAIATNVTGLGTTYTEVTASSAGTAANVCVTATGDKTDVRLSIPALTLKDQQIDTLILTKTTGGILMNGLLLAQQGALTSYSNNSARVRLVADAANAKQVTATINGTDLGTETSPTIGSYTAVTAGALTTTLTIDGTAVNGPSLTASAGGDYTLLVAGTVGSPTITLLTDNNVASTSTALPVTMRLVNGLNGVGGSATLTSNGVVIGGGGVAFGAASSYTNIAASAGAAELQVTAAGTIEWDVLSQTLSSGSVYTVFLLGDASPATSISGKLRVDN